MPSPDAGEQGDSALAMSAQRAHVTSTCEEGWEYSHFAQLQHFISPNSSRHVCQDV